MKPLILLMALPATLILSVSLATESKFDGGLPPSAAETGAPSAADGRQIPEAAPPVSKNASGAAEGREENGGASGRQNGDSAGTSACKDGETAAKDCGASSQPESKQTSKAKPDKTKDRTGAGATANKQLEIVKGRTQSDLTDVQEAASKAEERLGDRRIPPIGDDEEFLN